MGNIGQSFERLLPPDLLVRVPNDHFPSRPPLDAGITQTRMGCSQSSLPEEVGTSLDAKLARSPSVEVSTSCDIPYVCECAPPHKPRRPMIDDDETLPDDPHPHDPV